MADQLLDPAALAEAAARAAAEKRRLAEQNLFTQAIGATRPLRSKPVVHLAPTPPAPVAVQHQRDEAQVLRDSISDDFDVSSLLDTDDALSPEDMARNLAQFRATLIEELSEQPIAFSALDDEDDEDSEEEDDEKNDEEKAGEAGLEAETSIKAG